MRVSVPPPAPFDGQPGSPLILRDGSVATIRIAGPTDRRQIQRFFHELSPESRYHRFFTAGEAPDDVVDRLCAPVDTKQRVTLLASRSVDGADHLLAMASYLRVNDTIAEVAFAVDDRVGHVGFATGLLERLTAIAVAAGFHRFQATTLTDNAAMLRVFRDSGFMIRSKLDGTVVEVELTLTASVESIAAIEAREHTATVASIRPLVRPESVAVIGVSHAAAGLGRRIYEAMLAAGYPGPLYAVTRGAGEIAGRRTYGSMREVPGGVDMAVVAVPRDAVLSTVDDCAAAGVKSLIVISAGFAETGDQGRALQEQLLATVRAHGMRMLGPNCMGLVTTDARLNASFSRVFPASGHLAFSSQSGALGLAILAMAAERHLGLSSFVSVGNKADVSSNDLLQFWEDDPSTSVILLYLESFGNPRRFARLARRIGHKKPIVAVKAGRTREGSRAAGSHTAALAASELAVDALFHQTGVIRANTIDEMFDVAVCLESQPLPAGRRLAIVTNAGGPGILAVDACDAAGLTVAELSATTRARLASALPQAASLSNPVDLIASAGPDQYRCAIEIALTAGEIDALLIIYTAIEPGESPSIFDAIARGVAAGRRAGATAKPVLACVMAGAGVPVPIEVDGERIPAYTFPEDAARALGHVATYAEWRAAPAGLFWTFSDVRADEARTLCREIADRRGTTWLTPEELHRLVSSFGLPMVPGVLTRTADEAASVAAVLGFPVAAKLSSPRAIHKSDVDGVALHLSTAQAVRTAFDAITAAARERGLDGAIDGVLIQPMIVGGTEVLVGVADDRSFGPLVGVGLGGVFVEAIGGMRFRIAPLTDRDAEALVHHIPGFTLLRGYRGRPPADVDALTDLVLRVSRLAEAVPEVIELDLNPVIVLPNHHGCRVVDARIRVGPRTSVLS
jgi:acetyl coenzyme A synthetase (ADP forming)-like protein